MGIRDEYLYRYDGRTPVNEGDTVEVSYEGAEGELIWVPYEVVDVMAVQFTCYDGDEFRGTYWYADEGVAWRQQSQ